MSENILITGGAGFVGSHLCEHILRNTDWNIIILDRIDSTSTLDRLSDIHCWEKEGYRVKMVWHDLKASINQYTSDNIGRVDYIAHLAAQSHVDRSILDPLSFVQDNVIGTCNLLDFARSRGNSVKKINICSTDEVFGAAPDGIFYKETDMLRPENPYSASKVGEDALAYAFACTYTMPIFITRCMNLFGERQFYEKMIPNTIRKILLGEEVIVHGSADLKKAGTRFYIHARNFSAVLLSLFDKAGVIKKDDRYSGVYNIVGDREVDNLSLAHMIYSIIKEVKPSVPEFRSKIVNFHQSRPGHDMRYALDGHKLKDMGIVSSKHFDDALKSTVLWSIQQENLHWLGLEE